jgi:hypothetical protein
MMRARDGHHLANAQDRPRFAGRSLVLSGVVDSAGGDDGALPGHQPRVGSHGSDRAGVGERDGGPLKIGCSEFRRAGARYQVVEGVQVFLEIERAGVSDIRRHETAGAVLAGDVDGDPEIHLGLHHAERLAVLFGIGMIQSGPFAQSPDDGPPDEVRVGHLAAPEESSVVVDDAPVFVHHLDGDGALGSGQRNGDAGGHVFGDAGGRAAEWLELGAGRGFGRRGGAGGCREDLCRLSRGRRDAVRLEYLFPAFVHGRVVVQILLI